MDQFLYNYDRPDHTDDQGARPSGRTLPRLQNIEDYLVEIRLRLGKGGVENLKKQHLNKPNCQCQPRQRDQRTFPD